MRKLNRKTFDALSISKYVITEPDMGNQKNKCTITSHSTRGRDARKRQRNQDSTLLSFSTDFSKIQDTVRRRRSMGGQKISV